MDASRGRIVVALALAVGLLSSTWVLPVMAADCALSAPATGRVGTLLAIQGTGFPASSSVDIELTVAGGIADQFSVQSNASGTLEIALTPEPIDQGATTVVATAGSTCTAEVQFTVLGDNEPAPTAEPADADAAASAGRGAPRTDAAPNNPGEAVPGQGAWLVGAILLVLGVVGLLTTRPAEDRFSR